MEKVCAGFPVVTPHVGVWIETRSPAQTWCASLMVTPHVGVWIETLISMTGRMSGIVTPHVGVWIETAR